MLIHLNGQLIPRSEARLDPFDRGFIFGEGVYEGLRSIAWNGGTRIVGLEQHIRRMQRGLEAAHIPFDVSNLGPLSAELCAANNMTDAFVYWQVTGGTPGDGDPVRSRARGKNTTPTIFGYCAPQPPLTDQSVPPIKKAITLRDIRWEMGWLKSTSLMGNVVSAHRADDRHCDEAVFMRDGLITEGLATNVVLALPKESPERKLRGMAPDQPHHEDTELVTPSLDSAPMLAGITREILLKAEPRLRERPIKVEELDRATEIMFLGTITTVASAIELNGKKVGDGTPGPQARALLKTLIAAIQVGKDIE
jgi:D-alanine transaminase